MTDVKLYNTRTRTKEVFAPIDPKDVRMYVCGPTVYDRAHIGNARPVVVFDVLYRLLRHVYGEDYVTYVRNFTDVDDKINARAAQSGREIREITDETIGWYHEDMDALGALRPDREPRCTEYVPHMVTMIEELIVKGHAYPDGDGHVLFEVRTYDAYGTLARRSLDDMRAGARVEVATNKRDPMDFVLWKPSAEDQPGWDSPWGRGRPGWHIECSAMAREILGEVFDIHGGGIDLAFPHHENEMAQSCAAHGTDRMANVWMHNGYLMVEGEKMSKSLGNFFTVKDLRDKGVPGQVIRFVLLSAQYRQPLDWTDERATEAEKVLGRWFDLLDRYPNLEEGDLADDPLLEALCDDLNFPKALARLHELARAAGGDDRAAAAHLMTAIRLMGFDGAAWRAEEAAAAPTIDNPMVVFNRIGELLEARDNARKAKDFARSDEIRDAMIAAGLTITDTPKGAECEPCADFDPLKLMAIK